MKDLQAIDNLNLKLGRKTEDGSLDPIPRALGRKNLEDVSFFGFDLWNAYEVSFLLPSGKPVVYHMQAQYNAHSPFMVESKSFKLFLNSFNNQVFDGLQAFSQTVNSALARCVGEPVHLAFYPPQQSPLLQTLPGSCLDDLDYAPRVEARPVHLLEAVEEQGAFQWHSHLLRSNCPVTNQPDWGSILIAGSGVQKPQPESLLAYIIAYRNHQGFHESCCEAIYSDLMTTLHLETLEVTCFYTRRGGLDINPCRSSKPVEAANTAPVWRQ